MICFCNEGSFRSRLPFNYLNYTIKIIDRRILWNLVFKSLKRKCKLKWAKIIKVILLCISFFFTFVRIEWRATEIRRCLCGWNQRAPKIYRESLWWHDMLKLAIHTLVDKRIKLKIQQNLSKAAPYFPFNSREWPRQNFSILYLYNTIKTSDENKRYQLWNY